MNSIAIFGITAVVFFALATGLAVNARAAETFIHSGNGDLAAAELILARPAVSDDAFATVETPWLQE